MINKIILINLDRVYGDLIRPLRVIGYLGVLNTLLRSLLLSWMLFHYFVINGLNYSPLAIVEVVNNFLIGLVLMAIGLVALYVSNIHTEVINRPLYIV
jgi:polyisoprenyl-phosphate glycosyltransferase